MKKKTRLVIDLTFDAGGGVGAELVASKQLNDDRSGICFLTGEPKATCECFECKRRSSPQILGPKEQAELEVVFTHPRDAKSFTAFVSPNCTGEEALKGLIAGDEDPSWNLRHRTFRTSWQ